MNDNELVSRLSTLLRMDRDAVKLFDAAAIAVGIPGLDIGAQRYRVQHTRHAEGLAREILRRGREPVEPTAEFDSIMALHISSIEQAEDAAQAMITLRMAERIMNLEYAEALQLDMPNELRGMLERNLADEREHLSAIESWLAANVGVDVGVYL